MTPQQPADLNELRRRVRELRAVRNALRPDADDARVLSELTVIQIELDTAQRELRALAPTR